MFDRIEIKTNAKKALKHFYVWGLLACFIYMLLSGEIGELWSGFRSIFYMNGDEGQSLLSTISGTLLESYRHHSIPSIGIRSIFFGSIFLIGSVLGIIYRFFIVNVVEVGLYSFFLKNREKETNINDMVSPFQKEYLHIVKIRFLQNLYIWLWSLLFIIPGIIKRYEYYFIPYLLAENPQLTEQEAFHLSKTMTDGEKMNLFIFDLSFLGWLILGSFLGGIGQLFVQPYIYAGRSEVYVCLKERKL